MGSAVVLVVIIIAVYALAMGATRLHRATTGRGRCHYCHSRLRYANASYADVCAKCGREQPWAGEGDP